MQHLNQRLALLSVLIVSAPLLAACQKQSDYEFIEPAHVEHVEGSDVVEVTLTEDAIKRIDLQTAVVRETQVSGSAGEVTTRKVVPYSALMYGPNGETWVYVSPEPGKFQRFPVDVDHIKDDMAVLSSGPDEDTTVASVGAAELYGTETGMGGGH